MRYELLILGANSAIPTKSRFPTAQVLYHGAHAFLIDCGEGTQIQIAKYHVKAHGISHIFISHLHGDHIFGLPGLISSMQLQNRIKPLTIHGPVGIKSYVEHNIKLSHSYIDYPLSYNEFCVDQVKSIFENSTITVSSLPLDHRIETTGYLFKELPHQLNIDSAAIAEYSLSIEEIKLAKQGSNIARPDGTIIQNERLTFQKQEARSFAFCSDTRYLPELASELQKVDLLYHEATFLHEKLDLAIKTRHTTALEAGQFAKACNAKRLVIGHYSSRYDDLNPLLAEAEKEFDNTFLAEEGERFGV